MKWSHIHKQEACCSVGLNMCCLASMVEKINIPVLQVSLPFQHGPLHLASSYMPDLLLLFGACGSWGFWTFRCLDLNPEHLEGCEGRTSERRVFGSQRRMGKSGMRFPNIGWKEVPLQPEGEAVKRLGQLCFLGGSHRDVAQDGSGGPLVRLVRREVRRSFPCSPAQCSRWGRGRTIRRAKD